MLLINARVGPSSIQGLGLIAQQFIPTGTIVWSFVAGFDVEIPESFLQSLSEPARAQLIHYAEHFATKNHFVLSGDDDRFTNHSDMPNTRQRAEGGAYPVVIAILDICAGEEITCDYREVRCLSFIPGIPHESCA